MYGVIGYYCIKIPLKFSCNPFLYLCLVLRTPNPIFEVLIFGVCHSNIDHGYNISRILYPSTYGYNKDGRRGGVVLFALLITNMPLPMSCI